MKFLAGVALAAAVACAQPSFGWEATVRPPQAALPTVEIRIGYPGDYVPRQGSPLELRRTAAFDGMIGYRFEVDGKKTVDATRLTRAAHLRGVVALDMRQSTTALPREVVIEWRDAAGGLLASENAGMPPWTARLKTLRVTDEPLGGPHHLGEENVVLPPAALPARADWYRGWAAIALPAELWLSMAADVRQAMLASGVMVMTFGIPAPRALSPVDEAVLPVSFDAGRARAKPGAEWLRGPGGPRLVQRGNAVWAASEDELRGPLPEMQSRHVRAMLKAPARTKSLAAVTAIASRFVTMGMLVMAVAISLLLWWISRRGGAMVAATIAVALIVAHPWYRDVIRPHEAQTPAEEWARLVNGTYQHSRVLHVYGASPLRMREPQPADAQLVGDPAPDYGEVTSDGRLLAVSVRYAWPRAKVTIPPAIELWDGIGITIRDAGAQSLTFAYDLPFGATEVLAKWTHVTGFRSGTIALPGGRRGEATVYDGKAVRPENWWLYAGWPLPREGASDAVELRFSADGVAYTWQGRMPAARFVPYRMIARIRELPDGRRAARMVIPEGGIPPRGQALLAAMYSTVDVLAGATLEGDGGTVRLQKHEKPWLYTVAADDLRRITADHGLVTIHTPAPLAPRFFAVAEVRMTVEEHQP